MTANVNNLLTVKFAAQLTDSCRTQAPGEEQQLQGLKALQGLARNAAMFLPLQATFREAGGFAMIVKLIDAAVPPLLQRPPLQTLSPPPPRPADSAGGSNVSSSESGADFARDHSERRQRQAWGGSGSDAEARKAEQNGRPRSAGSGGVCDRWEEDEWGPGPQRIAPAVEAIAMLARNNPRNRSGRACGHPLHSSPLKDVDSS